MDFGAIVERMREVLTTSDAPAAERAAIESAMTSSAELKARLAAADARLASMLASQVSFPEKTIADCTRESLRDAAKATERADTLGRVPGFADALDQASVTPAHVDAITTKAKPLTDDQRAEYFERVAGAWFLMVSVLPAGTPVIVPRQRHVRVVSDTTRTSAKPCDSPEVPSFAWTSCTTNRS